MIAVLAGGWSKEREISLESGKNVYNALIDGGVECLFFDVKKDNLATLWQLKFDKAFILMHGIGGEDGFIQKQLEQHNIPFTGSSSASSKIAINKAKTKKVWQQNNLTTADFIVSFKNKNNNIQPHFPPPWVLKPASEGSSFGISKVDNALDLAKELAIAHNYDDEVVIEQYIAGREYTVAILNDKTLPIIEIEHKQAIWDYDNKYLTNTTKYHCPCDLSAHNIKKIRQISQAAFNILGASNWGRVDLILDANDNIFLLEINTIPGMTSHSLVPMAIKADGMSLLDFLNSVLDKAKC